MYFYSTFGMEQRDFQTKIDFSNIKEEMEIASFSFDSLV